MQDKGDTMFRLIRADWGWWAVVVCAAAVTLLEGCCNIGCKYDLRKYPTPITSPATHPVHLWNPDCNSSGDLFDKVLPPGYSNTNVPAPAPAKMPVGPTTPKAEAPSVPSWNDPLRGPVPVGSVGYSG